MRTFPSKLFLVESKYGGLSGVFLLFLANADYLQYMEAEITEAEIDATIVMWCRIEKKNYAF